jgi:hypothetical protein
MWTKRSVPCGIYDADMKTISSIRVATQLAIFMENRPGSLARACDVIAKAQINIEALATEGGAFGSHGGEMLVRMVVSDPTKAAEVLGGVGAVAVKADVLWIEGGNQPGMLAEIADRLAKADVNIESVYVSASSDAAKCLVIMRPSDVDKAQRALADL